MIESVQTEGAIQYPTLTDKILKAFIDKYFNHDAYVKTYIEHKLKTGAFSYYKPIAKRQYQPMPINPLVNF